NGTLKKGDAQLWEVATGKHVLPPLVHGKIVLGVAFSPDGQSIATGGVDVKANGWEATSGKLHRRLIHTDRVGAVAFSPDGKMLVTGGLDDKAWLWKDISPPPTNAKVPTQSGPQVLLHSWQIFAVAFAPDGRTVLTGTGDATANLWDVATGKQL